MFNFVRAFKDGDGVGVAGLIVRITEVGTNTPLKYSIIGSEAVLRNQPIVTDANGLVAVNVYDTDGRFDVHVYDQYGTTYYRNTETPGNRFLMPDHEMYVIDQQETPEVLSVTVSETDVELTTTDDPVVIDVRFLLSNGQISTHGNNISMGTEGTYVANYDFDDVAGTVTITPRGLTYVGESDFYIRGDFSQEVLIHITVTEA